MATMVHLMPFIESPHSFPSAGLDGLWFGHSLPPGPPVGMVVGWRVVPGLLDTWRLERFGQTVHSLFRKTELSRVPVCSQRLPFNNCRSHCAPGNLQPQQECFMTFQRSVHLKKKHVSGLCRQSLWPHGSIFALICIVGCEDSKHD